MRRSQISFGTIIAAIGAAIILYIILPSAAWWLLVGTVLLILGLAISKKCG